MQTQEAKANASLTRWNVAAFGMAGENEMLRFKQCGRVWATMVKPGGGYYRGSQFCPDRCSRSAK